MEIVKYSCHRTKIGACPSNKEINSLLERISFRLVVNHNTSNTQVNARVVGAASRDGELSCLQKSKKNTGSR